MFRYTTATSKERGSFLLGLKEDSGIVKIREDAVIIVEQLSILGVV